MANILLIRVLRKIVLHIYLLKLVELQMHNAIRSSTVTPRICGKNYISRNTEGSPPRMRENKQTHIILTQNIKAIKPELEKSAAQPKTVQRFVCASGGTRTHKPVRASDFKSDAYANSATEAAITYYAIYHCKEQAQRVAKSF